MMAEADLADSEKRLHEELEHKFFSLGARIQHSNHPDGSKQDEINSSSSAGEYGVSARSDEGMGIKWLCVGSGKCCWLPGTQRCGGAEARILLVLFCTSTG
jgi:hypothetical protein